MFSLQVGEDVAAETPLEVPSTLNSSPQGPPSIHSGKEKRHPSVTPRKFKRFFTPRTQSAQYGHSRRVLFDIGGSTGVRVNRNIQSSPLLPSHSFREGDDPVEFPRQLKRQKTSHQQEADSGCLSEYVKDTAFVGAQHREAKDEDIRSSPCPQRPCVGLGRDELYGGNNAAEAECSRPARANPRQLVKPIKRERRGGLSAQLFDLSIGSSGRPGRLHLSYPANDWRDLTGKFYSNPEDVHVVMSLDEQPRRTIPFVAVGLNTNSLVAVGDEQGRVRLLESAAGAEPGFREILLGFRVHTNAIIDMTLSDDDSLLATASGDQSARVVDMVTQRTTAILGIHYASLKQVRFQPGANNKNVLATSGRDGSIQIWDLRCKGYDGPQNTMWQPVNPGRQIDFDPDDRNILYPRALNSIMDAHKLLLTARGRFSAGDRPDRPIRGEATSNWEGVARSGSISVTSLQFLHEGLNHLLLSASEADASIKLWDIRVMSSKSSGKNSDKNSTPLSATAMPPWHSNLRQYGITSLNLSSDGARFYALCKDGNVYAYQTSHLMLGHVPELEISTNSRPRQTSETQEGLEPLYGLSHPSFDVNTFYVKSALRNSKSGHSELLAVGSSNDCAILFPTDERYLPRLSKSRDPIRVKQKESRTRTHPSLTCPIYSIGSPLVRGHDREVGCVTWTHDGELATVGDDLTVRCWREDYARARTLRTCGEQEGQRWGCGWARVNPDFDDDDMEVSGDEGY